jgi:hypothetical protein
MTKTLNHIIFFPPPKSEYFFQQHWESEYYRFEKLKKDIDLRIGRLFENLKKGHRSEVQMSVTSI